MRTLEDHLFGPGPKHILSLDGGGARGVVSLAFLERVEEILRDAHGGDPDFRLCDHFDLIGGTSTGAIIAAGLAMGFSVERLIEIYLDLAHRAFQGTRWHGGYLVPKFKGRALLAEIRRQVGHETLGSEAVRTGLAITAKRFDTGSPWIFHNNPRSRYFDAPSDDPTSIPNRALELAEILRASTAAPTFYEPEFISIADGVEGLFVDGGVSPYNNPALLLTMMATSGAYGYGWPTGADKLSLISVGTGMGAPPPRESLLPWRPAGLLAADALYSVITDCAWQAQAVLQWLGDCPRPWTIDSEAGDLAAETPAPAPLLRYQRYDVMVERDWLRDIVGADLSDRELTHLAAMDRPEMAERWLDIARRVATRQVDAAHLKSSSVGAE